MATSNKRNRSSNIAKKGQNRKKDVRVSKSTKEGVGTVEKSSKKEMGSGVNRTEEEEEGYVEE